MNIKKDNHIRCNSLIYKIRNTQIITRHLIKKKMTEFGYILLTKSHYVSTNKIIHVCFSHMIYLISHVTSLNNTCGWSYKLPQSKL